MSVARLERDFEQGAGGDGDERVPPQDMHAEQSVLGGMLLSKDAIADVLEITRGVDFYRPAHELVYDAILDLYGRGEPADAITVADELTKRGDLTRVGCRIGLPVIRLRAGIGGQRRAAGQAQGCCEEKTG